MQVLLYILLSASVAGAVALLLMTTSVWRQRLQHRWQRYRTRARPMQVSRRRDLTDNVFEIELTRSGNRLLRPFLPGQFITIQGPRLPSGVAIERRYSLASWATKPGVYRLCIKREAQGKLSNWLCEQALPGATLPVRPPDGEFHLQQRHLASSRIVLIAAGVGITPLKAMLEWLLHHRYQRQVVLFYTARNPLELLYHHELLLLAEQWPQFQYRPFITAPDLATVETGLQQGRISAEALLQQGGPKAEYYFCAGQSMIDSLIASLQALGVNSTQLHYELFSVGGSGCGPYEVTCGNNTINAEGFPTLLQVLEALDVPVDTDCRAGTCGRCRVTLESGTLKHTIAVSADIAPKQNQYLACCAIPESSVIIKAS